MKVGCSNSCLHIPCDTPQITELADAMRLVALQPQHSIQFLRAGRIIAVKDGQVHFCVHICVRACVSACVRVNVCARVRDA